MLEKLLVCLIAGAGAGFGTGLAGLSAAAVIAPMLMTFLDVNAYEAVGIALASDVLASAASACTYRKNRNIDVKNGVIMLVSVLVFTFVGSYLASFLPRFISYIRLSIVLRKASELPSPSIVAIP